MTNVTACVVNPRSTRQHDGETSPGWQDQLRIAETEYAHVTFFNGGVELATPARIGS